MKTTQKYSALLACIVILAGSVGTGVYFAVPSLNDIEANSKSSIPEKQNQPVSFTDNTETLSNNIKATPVETQFAQTNAWDNFDNDPQNPLYRNLFGYITEEVIENDINQWFLSIVDHSKLPFEINGQINEVKSFARTNAYKIDLSLSIYNNQSIPGSLGFNGINKRFNFEPYQVIKSDISINNLINYKFFDVDDKQYIGYYFDDVVWKTDSQTFNFDNFSFSNYSQSANKYVMTNEKLSGIGYDDIADIGNQHLSTLTADDLISDIIDKKDELHDLIGLNLDPVQNILQELVKNNSTRNFLYNISDDVGLMIDQLVAPNNPSLAGIGNLISGVLKDQKAATIVVENKQLIQTLLGSFEIDFPMSMIDFIFEMDEEQLNGFIGSIDTQLDLSSLLPEEFIATITELSSKGVLSWIIDNKTIVLDLVSQLMPTLDPALINLINSLFEMSLFTSMDNPVVNSLVELITSKDEQGNNFIKDLINVLTGGAGLGSMTELLDQVLFENDNLTTENLIKTLGAIANPRETNRADAKIIRYKQWWDSMKITNTAHKKEYNQSTHMANIRVETKYQFTKNLWINVDDLVKAVPANLTLNGVSLPIGLIEQFVLFDWLSINNGDYVSDILEINNKIYYDVKNVEGQYQLSWQANAVQATDVNMPKTVHEIWEEYSSLSLTRGLITDLTSGMLYHKYYTNQHYKANSKVLAEVVIENYNPNKIKPMDLSLIITEEQLTEVKAAVTASVKESTIPNSKYIIKKKGWFTSEVSINKVETKVNYDTTHLIDQFINVEYYEGTKEVPIFYNLNSTEIIAHTSFIGLVDIPSVVVSDISFWTTHNINNNGNMASSWKYSW